MTIIFRKLYIPPHFKKSERLRYMKYTPLRLLSISCLLILATGCKKDDLGPGSDVNSGLVSFVIDGTPYVHEPLTFTATMPASEKEISWHFGNGYQRRTKSLTTEYAYARTGDYTITLIPDDKTLPQATRIMTILKGMERLNGIRDYTTTYRKYKTGTTPPDVEQKETKLSISVVDNNTISLDGNPGYDIPLPLSLSDGGDDSLIFRNMDIGNAMVHYNTYDKQLLIDIKMQDGDSSIHFTAMSEL